jgi:hypothetical protein
MGISFIQIKQLTSSTYTPKKGENIIRVVSSETNNNELLVCVSFAAPMSR